MCIIYRASKIRCKNIKKFCTKYKDAKSFKSELRLIARKRGVKGYNNMPKDELIDAINLLKPAKDNKKNILKPKREGIKKKNTFKLKREEVKKSLTKPLKKNIFKPKRKEIKKSLMKPSKKTLKSKMKEIKEILYDTILDRDEKIQEIKKFFYNPKNNLFKRKEYSYKPIRIGNAFSSKYIEYKSNGDKDKTLSIKGYLDEIRPSLSDMINNNKTQCE